MKQEPIMKRLKSAKFLWPVLTILFISLVLQLIYTRRAGDFQQLEPENGILDVRSLDFSHTVYTVANDWDFYPNHLYSSQDFKNGTEPPQEVSTGNIPYGTHRLIIRGNPGAYLTICGYSVDYGSRIYVDGQELFTSGVVSEDPDTSVPKTGYLTVPICLGEDGEAEIICQYVNFVHTDGGYIHATYLSTPQNIEEYKTGNQAVSATLGGGLMILFFYFLLLGSAQREKSYLILALCCFLFSARDQLYFFLGLLPRSLPWNIEYRIYLGVVNLLPVSLLCLLETLYPVRKPIIRRLFLTLAAAALLLLAVLPTKGLVRVNIFSYLLCIPYLIYLIFTVIGYYREQKNLQAQDILSLCGFGILFAALTLEGILGFYIASVVRYGFSPTAMLIFVFLIALSISLRIQDQKEALAESRSRSQILENRNRMNVDFLRKVAHELKTPLTVISGYAQLTGMQLAGNQTTGETPENLKIIQQEAQRLADLVSTLKDYSYSEGSLTAFTEVSLPDLMNRVEAICRPLCLKNRNQIQILENENCSVHGNGELLLQIFINLVVNASRHTEDGLITVSVSSREMPGFLVFRVTDNGTGIDEKLLPHIFEKGTSGDGGSGLGLTICQEAVQAHGGSISVERSDSRGTVIRFTVPGKEC